MRSHAELGAFGRRRLALRKSVIYWLKDRNWVLVSVLQIDWMKVECSWVLNSTIWDREVICPTAVDILIIVTRRSFVWHATLRSRECIQLGPFRLRWFEFELFLEMYLHTVNDFFFVLLIVLYDRVYPLKWSLSSLCFSCSNSARLSRLSSCNFIVIKYSFNDAFLLIWRWKLYVCDWFFANERHRPRHSYDVLLFFIFCFFQTIQAKSNALFTLWEIGLWCL